MPAFHSLLPLVLPSTPLYQLGILQASAFHITHLWSSFTGGSGEGAFSSSSSEFSADPLRKQVTSGPNSRGSSKLGSSMAIASLPYSKFLLGGDIQNRVRAVLRLHLVAPPLLPSGSTYTVVSTL